MENVVSFFLLNNTQSKPHLWFIPALIYCYGVVLLLMKMHRTHWLRWAPLLLLVPLVLGEVVVGMLHQEVAAQYSRNAWFTVCPVLRWVCCLRKQRHRSSAWVASGRPLVCWWA